MRYIKKSCYVEMFFHQKVQSSKRLRTLKYIKMSKLSMEMCVFNISKNCMRVELNTNKNKIRLRLGLKQSLALF